MLQKLTYSLHGVMLTDTKLKELGLTALGHCMKLRDYHAKRKNVGSDKNERKEKLKKLRALIEGTSQSKSNSPRYGYDKEAKAALRVRVEALA